MHPGNDGDGVFAVLGVRHAKPGIVVRQAVGSGITASQQLADDIRQQELGAWIIAAFCGEFLQPFMQEGKK